MNRLLQGGNTALHVAAADGRTELVQALLAKGADKTIRNAVRAGAGSSATICLLTW